MSEDMENVIELTEADLTDLTVEETLEDNVATALLQTRSSDFYPVFGCFISSVMGDPDESLAVFASNWAQA
jgi:hypothetical protein